MTGQQVPIIGDSEGIGLAVAKAARTLSEFRHKFDERLWGSIDVVRSARPTTRRSPPLQDSPLRSPTNAAMLAKDDLRSVKMAGYSDDQIMEIIQHVALNLRTNYLNEALKTGGFYCAVVTPGMLREGDVVTL